MPFSVQHGSFALFFRGAKEKKHKRKLLSIALLSAFCGAAVSQASTGRHTPKGTADKTVTQRHSANNAALRQIYFVQLLSLGTHRAMIYDKTVFSAARETVRCENAIHGRLVNRPYKNNRLHRRGDSRIAREIHQQIIRASRMAKFYLMRHALASGLNSTDLCRFRSRCGSVTARL